MSEANHDCNKCVNGYFLAFDSSGFHNLCGAGHCYLCHQSNGERYCPDYEEGSPPDGVEPM